MQFTVTYRGANGAVVTEAVEAASRADCFARMKARGITPMNVKEGADRARPPSMPNGRARRPNAPLGAKRAAHGGRALPWVLLGLAIVLIGGGIWWWCAGREASVTKDDGPKKSGAFAKEVTPVVVPKQVAEEKKPLTPEEDRAARLKRIYDKYGTNNIPDNLKAVVYFLKHPPKRTFKAQGTHQYFRHPSERQIAGVLFMEPGTFFVMKPEFGEAFNRDFANALVDKIEINDDDTDEVREAKETMTAMKKEIAELCGKEGKKPSEIMNEQAAAMYELGKYQRTLEEELDRIHANPDLTDKDVEDYCKAANELLASKGLPQMPMPNLARRGIQLVHAKRRAERKAAKEAESEKNDKEKSK